MIPPNWITEEIERVKDKKEQKEAFLKHLEDALDDKKCQSITLDKIRTTICDDAWNRLSKLLRLVIESEEWGRVIPQLESAIEFWKRETVRIRLIDKENELLYQEEAK